MKSRRCCNCRRLIKPNRNPCQKYCSKISCQNVRKQKWRQKKHLVDHDYRDNQRMAAQKWRQNNPTYMSEYRAQNPEYVEKNRKQMKIKNGPKNENSVAKIGIRGEFVKSDALNLKSQIKTGTYKLYPGTKNGFVKSDALMVNIAVISRATEDLAAICKETTL